MQKRNFLLYLQQSVKLLLRDTLDINWHVDIKCLTTYKALFLLYGFSQEKKAPPTSAELAYANMKTISLEESLDRHNDKDSFVHPN